jgi:hypothetical protein
LIIVNVVRRIPAQRALSTSVPRSASGPNRPRRSRDVTEGEPAGRDGSLADGLVIESAKVAEIGVLIFHKRAQQT